MKKILLFAPIFLMMIPSVKAQKWQPGHFTDSKGNIQSGFIKVDPSGKAPIKGEGFIEFKDDEKAAPFKLSASDVRSFVAGRDSFVVAHAPGNQSWGKRELDFARVVLDEPVKLYMVRAGGGSSGSGFGITPGIGVGVGGGSYGGVGGGIGINLGGGGGGSHIIYYFGENTVSMQQINNLNFKDVMSDIMGDEPDAVDKIQSGKYHLGNIEKLITYFKELQASRQK